MGLTVDEILEIMNAGSNVRVNQIMPPEDWLRIAQAAVENEVNVNITVDLSVEDMIEIANIGGSRITFNIGN